MLKIEINGYKVEVGIDTTKPEGNVEAVWLYKNANNGERIDLLEYLPIPIADSLARDITEELNDD